MKGKDAECTRCGTKDESLFSSTNGYWKAQCNPCRAEYARDPSAFKHAKRNRRLLEIMMSWQPPRMQT